MNTIFRQTACFGIALLFAGSGRLSPASSPPLNPPSSNSQTNSQTNSQLSVAAVEQMPRLPVPLAVRDWRGVSQQYYNWVLDPVATGRGFPVVGVEASKLGFTLEDYVGGNPRIEALTCLSAVVGAKLVGLDPRHLHGIDYVRRAEAWYDPALGLYRNTSTDRSPVVYADIYGSSALGQWKIPPALI